MKPYPLVLFDLDGVIIDTEPEYTVFWTQVGQECLPDQPHFASAIKGHSLTDILGTHFPDPQQAQAVVKKLNRFEANMSFPLIPGALDFVQALHDRGVKTAIVTSSNQDKMRHLYQAHPELPSHFDRIFTAEDAGRSKPAPDCYLHAAHAFGTDAHACAVFEDSPSGLASGRASGAKVYGLATSLTPEELEGLCDVVVESYATLNPLDFTD